MAVMVLKNAYILINNVDLSNHVDNVSLTYEANAVETTAFGSSTKTRICGLKDWSVELELNQDYAAGSVDATLFPLVGGAAFPVEVRPDAGARSATNPAYTGNVILTSYPPIDGKVGELAKTKIKLQAAGDLSRLTV